ncbi:MAG: hypothetical protein AAF600_14530 [Bacteroidota bacterium]
MRDNKFFIAIFLLSYICSLILYAILKYLLNHDFTIKVPYSGITSFFDYYFYQYLALITLIFATNSTLLINYYQRQKIIIRAFVLFPLIGIITLIVGGFLCGILFSVHDVLAGYYPGNDRFMSNLFNRGIESGLLGAYIAFNSFGVFSVLQIIFSFGILEFLRLQGLLKK